MKKNKMIRIIVRTALIVFLIIILLLLIFPIYLKSNAMKNDYAFAESNDGNWKAYLIPDPLGMLSGYLIYQGEEDGVENVQISLTWIGEKRESEKLELEKETKIDEEFSTNAQKNILLGKSFYQFLEYGDRNAKVDLTIYWREYNKECETSLSVKYDKWNLNDIYSTIKYFFSII